MRPSANTVTKVPARAQVRLAGQQEHRCYFSFRAPPSLLSIKEGEPASDGPSGFKDKEHCLGNISKPFLRRLNTSAIRDIVFLAASVIGQGHETGIRSQLPRRHILGSSPKPWSWA